MGVGSSAQAASHQRVEAGRGAIFHGKDLVGVESKARLHGMKALVRAEREEGEETGGGRENGQLSRSESRPVKARSKGEIGWTD